MSQKRCPQCGAPIDTSAQECKYCGEKIKQQQTKQQHYYQSSGNTENMVDSVSQVRSPFQSQVINQQYYERSYSSGIDPNWPIKSKIAAGILAILFGGIGIHKFYLGKIGMGILCLLFAWTGIPVFIGVIEGIVYLCSSDENFQRKYHVRIM